LLSAHPNLLKGSNTGSILKPTFSLDSKTLCRYIVQDFHFTSIGERLLVLFATSHPSFASHWFGIYEEQDQGHKPLIFGDVLFFQIESVVLKNVYRSKITGGLYTQKRIWCPGLVNGWSLSFPGCPRPFEFELKSADVFFSCESIQVWGTIKKIRSFRKQLSKLKNELSRELYFTSYLAELHGNESQTLLLCNAYSSLPSLSWQNAPPPTVESSQQVESLSFGGPVFLSYSIKEDSAIASAVAACYGHFVTLMEPILLQSTISYLAAAECHSSFPLQCTVISTLLNFQENSKLQKRSHLLPFYYRTVFYS
jgi:hypothetical protein